MIVSRTPYRVSFFGGGSDYPAWFKEHGGAVLTSTIDHYCHIMLRRTPAFLDTKYRISWAKMENVDAVEDIEHDAVRGCLQAMGTDYGVEVLHAGDLPARSGLGSSSAFTVGMLHALHALEGRNIVDGQLANAAIHVEQQVLGETVGIQDQIECAFGGLNLIEIDRQGGYQVRNVFPPLGAMKDLQRSFMLFYTGQQRHASTIAQAQIDNMENREKELHEIQALVPQAVECLVDGNLAAFGALLHVTWMLKRQLSDAISSPAIDRSYEDARTAGALGGKLLGAGGGGFLLFYVPVSEQPAVREALSDLLEIPFAFTPHGSRILNHGS